MPEKKARVLDIGCGSGILTQMLSEHFEEVIGIDISNEMLKIARAYRQPSNVKYLNMNAEHLEFDEKFDYVVSRTTLHHIENKENVLELVKSHLANDGTVAILDNVSEVRTPKRIVYTSGSVLEFVPNVLKYGLANAVRIHKHCTSESWLAHLESDSYLSIKETSQLYENVYPNCEISNISCFQLWYGNIVISSLPSVLYF